MAAFSTYFTSLIILILSDSTPVTALTGSKQIVGMIVSVPVSVGEYPRTAVKYLVNNIS